LLIAGPANTGKSTVGPEVARRLGFTQVEMSSYAYRRWNAARDRGDFHDNIQRYMEDVIWAENPPDIIAQDLLASNDGVNQLVVCGPRRTEEIETFQDAGFDVQTLYLYTSSSERFNRYLALQSAGYAASLEDFVRRDLTEYSWGLSNIGRMRECDFYTNPGGQADRAAGQIVSRLEHRWGS
jgi:hypothetical protein